MKTALRFLISLFVSVIICVILASIFSTQRVIAALGNAGASVGFGERLSMSVYDIIHFGVLYGLFVLIAFLIAFIIGGLVFRAAKFGRPIVFAAAGATAMLVMLLSMQTVFFGVPIVGGARDAAGLILQVIAGAVGGYTFHRLSAKKPNAASQAELPGQ